MNSFKTNKFNKGDKVIRVGDTSAIGVNFGKVYTVDNPSSHSGFYLDELHNHVTLVEVKSSPSDKYLELYVEQRNYREMNPNDLREKFENLKFVRGCFQLGVIEYKDFGGYTLDGEPYFWLNGAYEMYKHLEKDLNKLVEFRDKQKEALDYFFKPYYDKQQQEKDELKTLIEVKMEEVNALVKQLNQLNQM